MRTLNDYFLTASIDNISNANDTWIAVPDGGKVIKVMSAINGTIATADATITVSSGGVSMGDLVIPFSGSLQGDVATLEPTANNEVQEGASIRLVTDAASSNTVKAVFTLVIRR